MTFVNGGFKFFQPGLPVLFYAADALVTGKRLDHP
jgi:hypothetical protein